MPLDPQAEALLKEMKDSGAQPFESMTPSEARVASLAFKDLGGEGVYDLEQPAPVPEWQSTDDSRKNIRIVDILQMSSGLRIIAPQDPDYDPAGPYPDHVYLYTGSVDSFHYAATRPLQWPPGTVGRYHNTNPVLINYLIRLGVEKRGDDYLSFPRRSHRHIARRSGDPSTLRQTQPSCPRLAQTPHRC